jgi:hypothetical protein
MSNVSPQADPRDRVISITVAVVSLVLGVLPIAGVVVVVVRSFLRHQPLMPPGLVLLFQVFALGLIGVSVTIFRALRRGEVIHWLRGGSPLNYLLLLLVVILGALMKAEANAIEHLMVLWGGVRPRVADLLMLLPIIAGWLVFAVYWRRASAARVRQGVE